LVDCGMFQGGPEAHTKNRARFAFDPSALDCVLVTHAHIDHSGLLPRLVAEGYRGPIYATPATCDLLEVMLLDSAFIQEKELEWTQERHAHDRNVAHRAESERAPLYTVAQTHNALKQLKATAYGAELKPHPRLRAIFRDAGHILGSAIIELWVVDGARTFKWVFSGDIGAPSRPLIRDPVRIAHADMLLVESTYGNRLHKSLKDTLAELEHAIVDTLSRKAGNVIVPAFAVGRTQDLLYLLVELHRAGRLPDLDIYVDSPLAMKATEITLRHTELLDPEAAGAIAWLRQNRGSPRIHFVQNIEESIALHHIQRGAIIISASGMCEAGRIKHHLRHNLPRRECTILITGFQAAGTLGRRLVDGAEEVRIFGIPVPVRADIYTIGGLSAHADQAGLLGWLHGFEHAPRHTYVVHGEHATAEQFAGAVARQLRWDNVSVPGPHATVEW
ncbi:MAG TPA: MBL fold metallo-hydrolase, partial [Burkholderiales bacterium]|nr:MBL fold metallo-hydrolase [Burkholderiales bacterium]